VDGQRLEAELVAVLEAGPLVVVSVPLVVLAAFAAVAVA
jgi:hypothetical protein